MTSFSRDGFLNEINKENILGLWQGLVRFVAGSVPPFCGTVDLCRRELKGREGHFLFFAYLQVSRCAVCRLHLCVFVACDCVFVVPCWFFFFGSCWTSSVANMIL